MNVLVLHKPVGPVTEGQPAPPAHQPPEEENRVFACSLRVLYTVHSPECLSEGPASRTPDTDLAVVLLSLSGILF